MATCFCTGQCRQIGYCPTAGGPPMAAPPSIVDADEIRRIVREEIDARLNAAKGQEESKR